MMEIMSDMIQEEVEATGSWKDLFSKLFIGIVESSKMIRCKNQRSESGHNFVPRSRYRVGYIVVCSFCGKVLIIDVKGEDE